MPKQSRSRMLLKNFRLPETLWKRVEEAANEDDVNPSDIIRAALKDYLDRRR